MRSTAYILLSLWLLVSVALADLKVGTLNCYLCFDPAKPVKSQIADKGPTKEQYAKKVENLASLIKGLDVVGLEEIGGENEAAAIAKKATDYRVWFVQGKDTYTGENVAALVRESGDIHVISAKRSPELENLSKHLVVTLTADKTRYAILIVHLLRPIGAAQEKHDRQLEEIRTWARGIEAGTVVVVMGDFNDTTKKMLPLTDSAAVNDYAPTHLSGQTYDHVFTSGVIKAVQIVRPPYPRHPNDETRMIWTDHFLVKATVGAR